MLQVSEIHLWTIRVCLNALTEHHNEGTYRQQNSDRFHHLDLVVTNTAEL